MDLFTEMFFTEMLQELFCNIFLLKYQPIYRTVLSSNLKIPQKILETILLRHFIKNFYCSLCVCTFLRNNNQSGLLKGTIRVLGLRNNRSKHKT